VKNRRKHHDAYIGLGSNLGLREKNIAAALNSLQTTKEIEVVKVSGLYETKAVGGPPDQPDFINAAAHLRTMLSPERLLAVRQNIESSLGRRRDVPWGPRTIDLDILIFDDESLPPDRFRTLLHERRFGLEPLASRSRTFASTLRRRLAICSRGRTLEILNAMRLLYSNAVGPPLS
jgi:2-amino-4-hydroxy-6-hydroxymethyldihydropteridine diphosphokinase